MSDYEEIEEELLESKNASIKRLIGGIKSSGEKRDFGTGAQRDSNTAVHKGRMDLVPAVAMHRFAKFLTENGISLTSGDVHALSCYNDAMQSMYLWLEGERMPCDMADQPKSNFKDVFTFDHLSNVLLNVQDMMHIAEDLPLWYPEVSKEYREIAQGNQKVCGFGSKLEALAGHKNIRPGMPRFDKISPILLKRVSVHYQLGGINYGDRNWELGMPAMVTWDSACRHLTNWLSKEETEDHLAAIGWNIMCTMHTIEMINREVLPAKLYDPPYYRNQYANRPF